MNKTKEILNSSKNAVPERPEGLMDACPGQIRKLDGVNAVLKPKPPKDKVGLPSSVFAIQISGGAAEQCCFMMDYHGEAVIVDKLHNVRCPLSQAHRKNSLMQPNK
ncbi:hypothetical protein V2P20_02735 [Methylobacter sp. Wu1]|uniref:hypothetical protein n=1 Tax=Methylobacter sp. Wu1 TaxID=3119359 RepID=UPI002F93FE12